MFNKDNPPGAKLPSSAQLIRSTAIALLVALILLVTAVMPAEYGIDPTGVGRLLGLKQMGDVKTSAAIPVSATPPASVATTIRSDKTSVSLKPGEGAEIKLEMDKGATVNYRWTVKGGEVNFDAHGEASTANISVSYKKGKGAQQDEGILEAAFLGQHGWYWKNRGGTAVEIELSTTGQYSSLKRLL